jgi:hypothetical protein
MEDRRTWLFHGYLEASSRELDRQNYHLLDPQNNHLLQNHVHNDSNHLLPTPQLPSDPLTCSLKISVSMSQRLNAASAASAASSLRVSAFVWKLWMPETGDRNLRNKNPGHRLLLCARLRKHNDIGLCNASWHKGL